MTNHITCDQFADSLADLMEDDVEAVRHSALESHALACAACGSLLADLRQLRTDAAGLPEIAPSRDLWSVIAARIDAPVIPITGGQWAADGVRRRAAWQRWVWMSAAAAVLVAITAGITYYTTVLTMSGQRPERVAVVTDTAAATLRTGSAQQAAVAPPTDPVPSSGGVGSAADARNSGSAAEPRVVPARLASHSAGAAAETSAEATYGREIARLHAIVEQRRNQLDPVTIGIIEHNLEIIDDAIGQCRAALSKDPASRFLIQSLNSALENKVELLRTAAMLPSRT